MMTKVTRMLPIRVLIKDDLARVRAALLDLKSQQRCTSYGALATAVGLDGAGRIARLTTMLEMLMEDDTRAGRPMLAALVLSRTGQGLPARGFFLKAESLGHDVAQPEEFHRKQLAALFEAQG